MRICVTRTRTLQALSPDSTPILLHHPRAFPRMRNDEAEDWVTIWTNTKNSSQNVIASEANYKVLMRWYLVPARIAKFIPEFSPNCFRGCGDRGTHLHIWWTCPLVQRFWETIFQMASTLHQVTLKPNPAIALLSLIPQDYTRAALPPSPAIHCS